MSESYLEVQLDQQPIELCKLLKIADLVAGGGEAKVVISEGYVLLNGEVEYQKRKKVYHNDIVEFNGEVLQVIINEKLEDEVSNEKTAPPTQTQKASSFIQTQSENTTTNKETAVKNDNTAKKGQRKPISF